MNPLRGPTHRSFLEKLHHPGGRILVLLALVAVGCIGSHFHFAWADHISLSALAVLLVHLGERGRA